MCPRGVKTVKLDMLASESPVFFQCKHVPPFRDRVRCSPEPSHVLCVCCPRNDLRGHLGQFLSQETAEGQTKRACLPVSNFFFP